MGYIPEKYMSGDREVEDIKLPEVFKKEERVKTPGIT